MFGEELRSGGIGYSVLRILTIITTQFVPYGGLTTVAMNYYRRLDHSKYRMDFASTNDAPEGLKQELEVNGDSYHRLPGRKNLIQYYNALKRICCSYNIVHVHANSATATIELKAAQAAGVEKRIIHIHNTTCSHMVIHKALKPIFNRTYTDAIACSKAAGEWIFPQEKYLVLNNAIDLERYSFSEENRHVVREELGLEDAFVVGHVGKMTYQKNHEFLVRTFAKLHAQDSNTKLLLVGGGELRTGVESLAEQLGIADCVVFTGMVNAAERYLSAMDCFVFPSRWEGLPLSIMEAQANGLKCIVSDKVTKEVDIAHQLVFLPINNNEDEWAYKIIESLSYQRKDASDVLSQSLRRNGFDIRSNVRELETIYSE